MENEHQDRFEVVELLHRYADAYDTRDDEAVGRCYTDDARFASVTPSGELREFSGVDAIRDNARNTFRNCPDPRRHVITNELVTVDGDVAAASCYLSLYEITTSGIALLLIGRYVDRLTRTDDGWRIAERVLHSDTEFTIPRG